MIINAPLHDVSIIQKHKFDIRYMYYYINIIYNDPHTVNIHHGTAVCIFTSLCFSLETIKGHYYDQRLQLLRIIK